jgi:hypothetical protein
VNKDKKPLSETHPELAKEAFGWSPKSYSHGSHKRLEWKCKKNHVWVATVYARSKGSSCPYCGGSKIWKGFNDLATTHPELAKEAYGWDPTKFSKGSNKKLEWKCVNNHIWPAFISNRTLHKSNCPVCSNQKVLEGFNDLATTHPEIAKEAYGWDPKKIIGGTGKKLDWICLEGHVWKTTPNNRTTNNSGCPVCSHFVVSSGVNDLETIHPELAKEAYGWDPKTLLPYSNKKKKWICSNGHIWTATIANRYGGSNCPYCSNKRVIIGFNDLATTNPELAKEAYKWDPKTVTFGSGKNRKWQCSQGHMYLASVSHRSKGRNCPYCSNKKVLIGFNDLATTHPQLAKEANGWDPRTVTAGTHMKLEWKCSNGHIWKTHGSSRLRGNNCPSCSTSGFDPNENAYLYFLMNNDWEMYQIGITNFLKQRIDKHSKLGWKLLDSRGPIKGYSAYEQEQAILMFLKSQKADLSPEHVKGKFDGYTESWTIDSYKVNNLKELIDKTREAGF